MLRLLPNSILHLALSLVAAFALFAQPAAAIDLRAADERKLIDAGIQYTIDEKSLGVYQISQLSKQEWVSFEGEINFGYNQKVHWIRFDLNNVDAEAYERILEIAYPLLDHVSVYFFTDGELIRSFSSGDALPFHYRPIDHRNFLFPLHFEENSKNTLYVRVQTAGAVQLPMTIWQERAFHVSDAREVSVQFLYYGILLIMVAFNILLYLLIRDSSFVTYVFFVVCVLTCMSSLYGFNYQYFLGSYPRLHELSILLSVPLLPLSITLFTLQYLNLKETSLFWYNIFLAFVAVCFVCVIGALVLPYSVSTRLSIICMLPISLGSMIAGVSFWLAGTASARLYCVGWMAILFGLTFAIFNRMGLIGSSFFVDYGLQISTTVQILMFSIALAARLNSERDARLKTQEVYVEEIRKRREVEEQLVYTASHHNQTGLPNRMLFEKAVRDKLENGERDELLTVLLHVRRFDDVNRSLGHRNADVLLRRIGEQINQIVVNSYAAVRIEEKKGEITSSAHIEGVSFCFALAGASRNGLLQELERLMPKLSTPIEFMGLAIEQVFLVGCSYYDEGVDPQTLLRQAFVAFDHNDAHGNTISIYEPKMNPYSPKRLNLMTELRSALEFDGLTLYFQPQIDIKSKRVSGFEALLRWKHHEFGFVPPEEFVSMAEKTGLMKPLTQWVLKRAVKFIKQLNDIGSEAYVSVNISALNLREARFGEEVAEILEMNDVEASRLVVEVTETAASMDVKSSLQAMTKLEKANIRLSIDDIGIGHSTLSFIRQLPIHEMKIDRSFTKSIDGNKEDAAIVKAMITMSHDLGYRVIAEGVESQQSLNILSEYNCDCAQGYHIAKPMPPEDVFKWLRESDWTF
ncbi:MAG: EAL domain-containing protein [Agarilytica sp.]